MAGTFTIYNKTNTSINVALSNAGFVYFYRNSLAPGAHGQFSVAAVGWDFYAVFDFDGTKIDPTASNAGLGAAIGFAVLGVIGAAAGVALTVVTFGAAAPVAVAGVTLSITAIQAASIAVAAAGAVSTLAGVGLAIAEGVATPVTSRGYYGGYDYKINVNGDFGQTYDKTSNRIIVVQSKPLTVTWENETLRTSG